MSTMMRTPTSTVHANGMSGNISDSSEWVKHSTAKSHTDLTAADSYDMSPLARKIVYLTLAGGVVFLVAVAAYVWHGYFLWQNLP